MEGHISYKDLLEVVSWGVFNRRMKGTACNVSDLSPVKGAVHNGKYMGSPGKDIYLMLPFLSDDQMKEIVLMMRDNFPKKAPGNHLNIAACVRFIYGQFEKNGILRSEKDFVRMKQKELDWSMPRKFLKMLYKEFDKDQNYYGLSILCEMEAHRLGDEAVINRDKNKLSEMEETYNKSMEYARKCMSYKQLFTPYYWCCMYFIKYNKLEKAVRYAKLTIKNAEKYCPDARDSYVDKLIKCIKCVKTNDKKGWKSFYKKYRKNAKNKCVKRAFKKVKE